MVVLKTFSTVVGVVLVLLGTAAATDGQQDKKNDQILKGQQESSQQVYDRILNDMSAYGDFFGGAAGKNNEDGNGAGRNAPEDGYYGGMSMAPYTPPTMQPQPPPTLPPRSPPTMPPYTPPTMLPQPPPTMPPYAPPTMPPYSPPTMRPVSPPTMPPYTPPTMPPYPPPTMPPYTPPTMPPYTPPTMPPYTPPTMPPYTPPTMPPAYPVPTVPAYPAPTVPAYPAPTVPAYPAPTPAPVVPAYSTPLPTTIPSRPPSEVPSAVPSAGPSAVPSKVPTPSPSAGPTPSPSAGPTPGPTGEPSEEPTLSVAPSEAPSGSDEPSAEPSAEPTSGPTAGPTVATKAPKTKAPKTKGKGDAGKGAKKSPPLVDTRFSDPLLTVSFNQLSLTLFGISDLDAQEWEDVTASFIENFFSGPEFGSSFGAKLKIKSINGQALADQPEGPGGRKLQVAGDKAVIVFDLKVLLGLGPVEITIGKLAHAWLADQPKRQTYVAALQEDSDSDTFKTVWKASEVSGASLSTTSVGMEV